MTVGDNISQTILEFSKHHQSRKKFNLLSMDFLGQICLLSDTRSSDGDKILGSEFLELLKSNREVLKELVLVLGIDLDVFLELCVL